MDKLIQYYDQFLKLFPDNWHFAVSVIIIVLFVMILLRFLRYGLIGLLILVIFVPASVPVLRNIGIGVWAFIQHALGSK